MTNEHKQDCIREMIGELNTNETIALATLLLFQWDNDSIARYLGYRDELDYDKQNKISNEETN